jgi:hypothetical protein
MQSTGHDLNAIDLQTRVGRERRRVWVRRRTKAGARQPQDTASTDQPRIRDSVMRGAKWARRNRGSAGAGADGDAADARGLNSIGEGHRQQDGGRWEGARTLIDLKRSSHIDAAKFPSIVSVPLSDAKPTHSLPRIVGWSA